MFMLWVGRGDDYLVSQERYLLFEGLVVIMLNLYKIKLIVVLLKVYLL